MKIQKKNTFTKKKVNFILIFEGSEIDKGQKENNDGDNMENSLRLTYETTEVDTNLNNDYDSKIKENMDQNFMTIEDVGSTISKEYEKEIKEKIVEKQNLEKVQQDKTIDSEDVDFVPNTPEEMQGRDFQATEIKGKKNINEEDNFYLAIETLKECETEIIEHYYINMASKFKIPIFENIETDTKRYCSQMVLMSL